MVEHSGKGGFAASLCLGMGLSALVIGLTVTLACVLAILLSLTFAVYSQEVGKALILLMLGLLFMVAGFLAVVVGYIGQD